MKRNILFNLLLFCGVLTLASTNVAGQGGDLNEKVEALETKVSKMPTLSGYANILYLTDFDNVSSLSVKRARFSIAGNLSSKFDYKVQFAMENSPKLIDAYIRIKLSPAFNLQAGQFKVPLIYENYAYSPMTLEVIDNSMLIGKYLNNSAGRDIGVSAYGSFIEREGYHLIDYAVGVYNGSGINKADNDKAKDVAGRLHFNVLQDLAITTSAYHGTVIDSATHHNERYGVGLLYDNDKLVVRSEYFAGRDEDLKSFGYYVLAEYWINPKIAPLIRLDSFNYNSELDEMSQYNCLVGFEYWPIKSVRLQANYTCKAFNSGAPSTNHFGLMLSYKF